MTLTSLPERITSKIRHEPCPRPDLGACWKWTAAVSSSGYGITWNGTALVGAHVFTYTALVAPVPAGLHLDHLCRVPLCVNPQHLEPVTPGENVRRGNAPSAIAARTGLCQQGHPLSGSNLYVVRATGKRRCRTCQSARMARQYAARRAAK